MDWERLRDEQGQGIVEYALLLAFVVVLASAIVGGDTIRNGFMATMEAWASLFE